MPPQPGCRLPTGGRSAPLLETGRAGTFNDSLEGGRTLNTNSRMATSTTSPEALSSPDDKRCCLDKRVARALRQSCHPSLLHVRCEVRGGLAILRGRTPTHYLKQLAQEIARRTRGVSRVINQIVVRPEPN